MTSPDAGAGLRELADRLGSAVLFLVVGVPVGWIWISAVWGAGIDNWLHYRIHHHGETAFLPPGIEFVVVPLAAIAAVALRWGTEVFDAPAATRSLWLPLLGTTVVCTVIWLTWVDDLARLGVDPIALVVVPLAAIAAGVLRQGLQGPGAPPPRAVEEPRDSDTPWLPWLGAAVGFAVIGCLVWSWALPQTLIGPNDFGVARWIGTALLVIVAYFGMIFFPRLTASLAGAVVGPAVFAVVGYILFPSLMRDPEWHLADTVFIASRVGATLVVTAMVLVIAYSETLRQRPLTYAVWVGVLTFCMAVGGTFNGLDGTT
ncbi:MAG: hypothetical protein OXG95_11465 [Chloroflexi bacterium]|nr:hypothetical protein [Chloroflexota bacterium]